MNSIVGMKYVKGNAQVFLRNTQNGTFNSSTLPLSLVALAQKSSFSPRCPVADNISRTNEAIVGTIKGSLLTVVVTKSGVLSS